ncbi:hypothetical protein L7F22_042655 [Adiantum nelumboides]|nr:hypothetical protein [Adiantum nelumboides]
MASSFWRAYQALGMIEDLPAAGSRASLIQHARFVPKAVKTTTTSASSRTTRSTKKSSSDDERTDTNKDQDSDGLDQEDSPKGAEVKGPFEHEQSDEEDTSTPLYRKNKKHRTTEQILMDETMARVEARIKELTDARAAKATKVTKPTTMTEARKIKMEKAKALQEERRKLEAKAIEACEYGPPFSVQVVVLPYHLLDCGRTTCCPCDMGKLKAAARLKANKDSQSTAPAGGVVICRALTKRKLHTFEGMIGYCLKDNGQLHFQMVQHHITAEHINQGIELYMLYCCDEVKNRVCLTPANIFDREHMFLKYSSRHPAGNDFLSTLHGMIKGGKYYSRIIAHQGKVMEKAKIDALWTSMVYPSTIRYHDISRIFVIDDLYSNAPPRAAWFLSRWTEIESKNLAESSPGINCDAMSDHEPLTLAETLPALDDDYLPLVHRCDATTVA